MLLQNQLLLKLSFNNFKSLQLISFFKSSNSVAQKEKTHHFKVRKSEDLTAEQKKDETHYHLPHAIYTQEQVNKVIIDHKDPITFGDKISYYVIQAMRLGFDTFSGYKPIFPRWQQGKLSETAWLNRVIFLETVAGVPGFVGAMHRHLRCLRTLKRDWGWIHTLLEEAENERMHLETFMEVKQPSIIFRTGVVIAQVFYVSLFSVGYFFFPRICHRVVGYLEEEAVKTYTKLITNIEQDGTACSHWRQAKAPQIAQDYWRLSADATLLDVVYAVRKDEEHHKIVNHKFADDYTQKSKNAFPPGF